MLGRKAKRIAQLEAELEDALKNLAHVVVRFPEPAQMWFQQARIRKGQWYRASIEFRVSDTWKEVRNIGLFETVAAPYFDGTAPPTVGPDGPAGDSGASER